MSIELVAGDQAPSFTLKDQDGQTHKLADYRGKTVVLYFYPRDDTPGCTKEACSFRDEFDRISKEGAIILGVSIDDADSHRLFRDKYNLPFPLLVDDGAKVASRYGSWGEKNLYGKIVTGMTRSTFVIGPNGKLIKVWKRARAANHGQAVLKTLQS